MGTSTASAEVGYVYDLAGDVASFTNGMTGTSAMSFTNNYNGADELASMTAPDSPGSGSNGNFNLFTGSGYTPSGAISNALIGPGISLARSYNDRLLPTGETDTVGTTPGTATVQIAGAEEASAFSSGNITFSGTEQSMTSDGTTVYDQGNIMVIIDGMDYQVQYGEDSTPSSLAADLASVMSCDPANGGNVQADAVGATVYFASCSAGLDTTYTISAYDDGHSSGFANYSFTPTASGANMTLVTSAPSSSSAGVVAFAGTESSGMSSVYSILVFPTGSDEPAKVVTLDASSTSTPDTLATTLVSDLGSCSTSGVVVTGVVSGATVTLEPCQSGTSYYFEGGLDSCSGGSGSCISMTFINPEYPGVTSGAVYDTGTISLTIDGTQVATTTYGEDSTPGSIVSALISASSGNLLVNLTAGSCSGTTCNLTLTAQDEGTPTDYSYAVNVEDTSSFDGTSFAASASSGELEGGTSVPLYSWAINTYEADGDVRKITDSVEGTWTYTYDNLNRVLTADATAGPDSGMDLTWAYDRYGNRWSQTATGTGGGGATQPSLTFNGNNNRVDGYSYDAAGNLLNDGLNQYTYDEANRILSINNQATGYVYDAEGNRVAKLSSGGTVETVYLLTSGNQQLTELSGSGGWNHTNVYAPGGRLLATYDASGQPSPGYHYNLTDWLGTKRMQTTAAGNSQETCTSNPYGDGLSCTGGADATEQHFTGKDHDTESNLDYFYARYYSETLGRFMTPDWAAAPAAVPYAAYGDPQSLNLYAYVLNNPLTGIDATGHYGENGSGNPENSAAEQQATAQSESQSEASSAGSSGNSNSTGKSTKEVPGTNHTPGAPKNVSAPGSGKQPSGGGKTVGQTGQTGNHPGQTNNTNQQQQKSPTQSHGGQGKLATAIARIRAAHGVCTKMEVTGAVVTLAGGVTFAAGSVVDATVVGSPAGVTMQAVGGTGAVVGGTVTAAGALGKFLGLCN